MSNYILGGLAALISAASWAIATILWRKIGEEISPFSMNLGRGVIGIVYLGIVLIFIGFEPIDTRTLIFLGLSGLFGITLADTFFFLSLMNLGPRLTSLMGTLAPVFITVAAVIFLGERLSLLTVIGIIVTVGSLTWVMWERLPVKQSVCKNKPLGIQYGLVSIVCMTIGVLFAKIGVNSIAPMQGTLIRLLWGMLGLSLWGLGNRQLGEWINPLTNLRLIKKISVVVFISIFGGFWLSMVALKYIEASVASTLNAMDPILVLPMVAVLFKEKISPHAIMGSLVGVGGVVLIMLGNG